MAKRLSAYAQSPGFGPQHRSKLGVVGIKPSLVPCPGNTLEAEAEVVQVIPGYIVSLGKP